MPSKNNTLFKSLLINVFISTSAIGSDTYFLDYDSEEIAGKIVEYQLCDAEAQPSSRQFRENKSGKNELEVNISQNIFAKRMQEMRDDNATNYIEYRINLSELSLKVHNGYIGFLPLESGQFGQKFSKRCDIYADQQTAYLLQAKGFDYYKSHATSSFPRNFCSYSEKKISKYLSEMRKRSFLLRCYEIEEVKNVNQ